MQTGVKSQTAGVMDETQMVNIVRYEAPVERWGTISTR